MSLGVLISRAMRVLGGCLLECCESVNLPASRSAGRAGAGKGFRQCVMGLRQQALHWDQDHCHERRSTRRPGSNAPSYVVAAALCRALKCLLRACLGQPGSPRMTLREVLGRLPRTPG